MNYETVVLFATLGATVVLLHVVSLVGMYAIVGRVFELLLQTAAQKEKGQSVVAGVIVPRHN